MAFTCTYSPAFKQIDANCPHFCIGTCTGNKENPCIYKHHKKCNHSVFCDNENCKFGHSVSYTKRMIINKIYDIYDREFPEKCDEYKQSENHCSRRMFCTNPNCEYDHQLYMKDREFILSIGNSTVSDDQALQKFTKKYASYLNVPTEVQEESWESFEIEEDKSDKSKEPTPSPTSETLSATQTVPSVSPMPVSFVSLFKDDDTPNHITNEDNSDDMANTMSTLIKDISINTNKANEIREKIAQMEEELAIVLSKISSGKEQIRDLAYKIAE